MKNIPQHLSHYRLESSLGSGGMGTVYRGVDRRDGTLVAIKLLHDQLADDPSFRERFEQEAHVAALLRSPYTVRILEYGSAGNRYFIAMEYVHGETLKQVLSDGPLAPARAVRIAVQVARALEEAEARAASCTGTLGRRTSW
jgi:serine/threonine protein kinase